MLSIKIFISIVITMITEIVFPIHIIKKKKNSTNIIITDGINIFIYSPVKQRIMSNLGNLSNVNNWISTLITIHKLNQSLHL